MNNISQGHAKGGQDPSILVNYHGLHAKSSSDTACVLSTRPSKAGKSVKGCIVTLPLGQRSYGAAHGLVGDCDVPHGNLLLGHHFA